MDDLDRIIREALVSDSREGSTCPPENDLIGYVENTLSPEERAEIERHLDHCYHCVRALDIALHDSTGRYESGAWQLSPDVMERLR